MNLRRKRYEFGRPSRSSVVVSLSLFGFALASACEQSPEPAAEPMMAADPPAPPSPLTNPPHDPAARESAARADLKAARSLVATGDVEGAQAKLEAMKLELGDTQTYRRRGRRLAAELAVVGQQAPALTVDKWFRQAEVDLSASSPTVVVFFEQWCPHCRNEIPKLDELYAKHKAAGLQLVALTKMTKGSTVAQVQSLIEDVSYPVAKEDGALSRAFAVSGIPAAAVVKDGKIVWRGHPAALDDASVAGWLASSCPAGRPNRSDSGPRARVDPTHAITVPTRGRIVVNGPSTRLNRVHSVATDQSWPARFVISSSAGPWPRRRAWLERCPRSSGLADRESGIASRSERH
ncbi:MAG: TlpA family protein disulfide reductase [Myxococcales bacterium FL481]|nr:MAG: TlpA family protein disulfide reductase [Myxococcales bacterium FL481]